MDVGFQGLSALFAIMAAVFWFMSARVKIPDMMDSIIGEAFKPFQKAAKLNAWAAGSAGISALIQAGLILLN
jgi:hypothetical protein